MVGDCPLDIDSPGHPCGGEFYCPQHWNCAYSRRREVERLEQGRITEVTE